MNIDPLTIFAAGGVISLLIERFFYYKSRYKVNRKNRDNPKSSSNFVSLPRFHQEFIDFKDQQKEWNEKREGDIKKLDDRLDKLEKGRK